MTRPSLALLIAASLVTSCAPLIAAEAPDVPADFLGMSQYRVANADGQIILDYGGVLELGGDTEEVLSRYTPREMLEELQACASGDRRATLRYRIDRFENDWPDSSLNLNDEHGWAGGRFELVDRETGEILFRGRLDVRLPTGDEMRSVQVVNPPAAQVAAELLGRALCEKAFGSTQRPRDSRRQVSPI